MAAKLGSQSITVRTLKALKPSDRRAFLWDGRLIGFGIAVQPSGAASFIAQVTVNGKSRRTVLGRVPPPDLVTAEDLEAAQAKAKAVIEAASRGIDPNEQKRERRAALSVRELCELYLEAAQAGAVLTRFGRPKKASTVAIDRGLVARHIAPTIGGKAVAALTRADVQRMIDDVTAGKTATTEKTKTRGKAVVTGGAGIAARAVELLGGIWSWGAKRDLVPDAPFPSRNVDRHRGKPVERRLSPAELRALGKTLAEVEAAWTAYHVEAEAQRTQGKRPPRAPSLPSPATVAAMRLIALTGLRHGEAAGLRWAEIDEAGSALRLAETKTGRSVRPIGASVLDLFNRFPQTDDEYVFPARTGNGHADLKKGFTAAFAMAGIAATAHDLRRTFGSVASDLGYGDATIAELLGHARRGVTERHYVRRVDAVMIEAASRVAATISAMMDGGGAEIVQLHSREI